MILLGKVTNFCAPYNNGEHNSVQRVRVEVGNGRYFVFENLNGYQQQFSFDKSLDRVREGQVVSIIPRTAAEDAYNVFRRLSSLAGDDRFLDGFVSLAKNAPGPNKIVRRKNTKSGHGEQLKAAVREYHRHPSEEAAERVIRLYLACDDI